MKLPTLCIALFAVAACGSKAKPPTATPEPTEVAWKDMNKEQREDYMETTVLPTMKEKFTAFDAKYADMNCKTCHGAGAEDKSFKMPNPELPKLDFSKKEEDYTPEQKKIGEFMGTVVVPEMAHMLGEQPYDPATQQGFGCLECHTTTDSK